MGGDSVAETGFATVYSYWMYDRFFHQKGKHTMAHLATDFQLPGLQEHRSIPDHEDGFSPNSDKPRYKRRQGSAQLLPHDVLQR